MIRVALHAIMFGICLFVAGNAVAADITEQEDVPKGATETRDNAQQDKPPDEIQQQYITRLKRINADLLNQHTAFSKNYAVTTSIHERINSKLEWGYADIPIHILKNLQDLSAEKTNIEARIGALEKEKKDLESNARSFYKDKIPEWLSQQWVVEEKRYLDSVDGIYLQLRWSLRKPKGAEDEKQYLDFIDEYYRQRRKGSGE
jgi:hypothetical protein